MAGKKIVWAENGLNIGSRDSGLGFIIKVRDILLSASKFLKQSNFKTIFHPYYFLSCHYSHLEPESI